MKHLKTLAVAQEAIQYQGDSFFKDLVAIIRPFNNKRELVMSQITALVNGLQEAINKRTGAVINVTMVRNTESTGILMPMLTENHVLQSLQWGWLNSSEAVDALRRYKGSKTGHVDLKKSKLTGVFTKFEARLILSLDHFELYNTPSEEIAALVLHEVGHWFTYCEFLDRTVATNQLLAGVDRMMRSGADASVKEIYLRDSVSELDLDKSVFEEVKTSSSPEVVFSVLTAASARKLRTQSDHIFYDHNSFEMLSDQFALRHGAGAHLASYLDRSRREDYTDDIFKSNFMFNMSQIMSITFKYAIIPTAAVLTATTLPFASGFMAVIFVAEVAMSAISSGMTADEPTYDHSIARLNRMRQELIEHVKLYPGDAEISKSATASIALIDKMQSDVKFREGWLTPIYKAIFSGLRSKLDVRKLHQELEKLAMNDLFLLSSQLKHGN